MTAVEAGICPGDLCWTSAARPGERAWTRRSVAATERWSAGMFRFKLGLIRENAARCGFSISGSKGGRKDTDEASVGAPMWCWRICPAQGLGTIGKKPDIKYRITPEQIDSWPSFSARFWMWSGAYVKLQRKAAVLHLHDFPEGKSGECGGFLERHQSLPKKMEQILPKAGVCDGFTRCSAADRQKETGKSQSDALVGAWKAGL